MRSLFKMLVSALALSAGDFSAASESTYLTPSSDHFGLADIAELIQSDSFAFSQTTTLSLIAGLATVLGVVYLTSDPRDDFFNAVERGDLNKIRALFIANRFDDTTIQTALKLALFYHSDDKTPGQAAIELYKLMTPIQTRNLFFMLSREAYATFEPRMSNGVMIMNHPISPLECAERMKIWKAFELLVEESMVSPAVIMSQTAGTSIPKAKETPNTSQFRIRSAS
jgi:hypothetical protein